MFKKEEKKMTMEVLLEKLKAMGLISYHSDDHVITVMYTYFNSEMEPQQGISHFVRENPADIYKDIVSWITDKSIWVDDDKYLVLAIPMARRIDLEYELLKLGFKFADVELQDTNFVTVDCRYCYINEDGEFKYDGKLQLDNIGNAFMTLEYIRVWIDNFNTYRPGCTFKASINKGIA